MAHTRVSAPTVGNDDKQAGRSDIFSPVIERAVEGAVSGKSAIDLDTGKLYTGPQVVKAFKELDDWMKATGVDALGMLGQGAGGLGGFDMVAMAVEKDRWDISVAELKATLAMSKPGTPQMIGKGALPATYLFKTREGGIGVLQIVGFVEKPSAVKIRYKLVRRPVPAAAAASCDLDAVLRQSFIVARRRGDKETAQKTLREIGAGMKNIEALLKGTVAEIPWTEMNERIDAWRKAVADKDQKEIERLAKEMIASAIAVDRLVHGTASGGAAGLPSSAAGTGRQAARGTQVENKTEAARIKLEHAEKVLREVEARYKSGFKATELDYLRAKQTHDVLAAELKGDAAEAARVKLQYAEKLFAIVEAQHKAGAVSFEEYERARLARDLAAAEVKKSEKPGSGRPAGSDSVSPSDHVQPPVTAPNTGTVRPAGSHVPATNPAAKAQLVNLLLAVVQK